MSRTRFRKLPKGSALFHIHPGGQDPLWFGPGQGRPPRHRFDSPDGGYGVCYLAHTPAGAFVESFLRDPESEGAALRILVASELRRREIVAVRLARSLKVARLRGPGLSWRGITASVSSSPVYGESQRLSAAIHGEDDETVGIEYRCRHDDDQLAVALFDRAGSALRVDPSSALSCLPLAIALQGIYRFVVDRDA